MFFAKTPKVALISLPWAPLDIPPISIGLLKSILEHNDIECHSFYFAQQFYSELSDRLQRPIRRLLYEITSDNFSQMGNWLLSEIISPQTNPSDFCRAYSLPEDLISVRKRFTNLIKQLSTDTKWHDYTHVGFSCGFEQLVSSLAFAKSMSQIYSHKFFLGGYIFREENAHEILNSFPCIDAVFIGESEQSITKYILGQNPPGVMTRISPFTPSSGLNETEFNELPLPNYDEFYKENNSGVCGLEISRGCWYGSKQICSFCNMVSKEPYRIKKKWQEDANALASKYGIKTFDIADLVVPQSALSEMDEIEAKFIYNLRVDTIKPAELDILKTLKKTSARIYVGIETLHPKLLKAMKKGHSVINAICFLKWAKYYDLDLDWQILFGAPGEKPEYYIEMIPLLKTITHFHCPSIQPVVINHGSPDFYSLETKPLPAYKFVYPSQVRSEKLAWYFSFKNAQEISNQVANTNHIKEMIDLVQHWKICSDILIKKQNQITDSRCKKRTVFTISPQEEEVIDYCFIPRAGAEMQYFAPSTISALLGKHLLIKSGNQFLSLTRPERSIQEYQTSMK